MNDQARHIGSPGCDAIELEQLLTRLREDDLSGEEIAELERVLIESSDARRHYYDSMRVWSELTRRPRPIRVDRNTNRKSISSGRRVAFPKSRLGFPIWIGIAASLATIAAVAALYVSILGSPPAESIDSGPSFVSVISATGDLYVGDGLGRAGDDYGAAPYEIVGGAAEFLLSNRVAIELRGKSRISMLSPVRASLQAGSASFRVPHGVNGFTVHLPSGARVLDLGTAFSIHVDPMKKSSYIRVSEGRVQVEAEGQLAFVSAGEACRVDAQGVIAAIAPGAGDWLMAREDLVLYFPIDETADALVNRAASESIALRGTLGDPASPATSPTWDEGHLPGKPGLRFVANQFQRVTVSGSQGIDLSARGSVAMWIRLDDPTQVAHLINKVQPSGGTTAPISEFNLAWTGGDAPRLYMHVGQKATLSEPIQASSDWLHIAATWDLDAGVVVYVDGREVGRRPILAPVRHAEADITIGHAFFSDSAVGLTGSVSEIVVLSGVLTADDIRQLYESVDADSNEQSHPIRAGLKTGRIGESRDDVAAEAHPFR